MSPDTLNPNASFNLQVFWPLTRAKIPSGETGGLLAPLWHKSIFAVQFWGEPGATPPSPQAPHLHQRVSVA